VSASARPAGAEVDTITPSDKDESVDDKTILDHIHELVAEEKTLRATGHVLNGDDRRRLESLEQQLDQAWDLLRQRRAREDLGENPDDAKERSVNEVESYLQ
jgi:Protein of unknown function (DUF2630)